VLELRPRRALLYVPGDSERKICKSAGLGADVTCLDLEDAVAANRKAEARDIATKARFLRTLP
jgi:citrate lyase beta subunit